MALAAFLNAIFNLLLSFGKGLDKTLPPLILVLGANLSQLVNCFALSNFLMPSNPTSIIKLNS